MATYQCPTCMVVANIVKATKVIEITLKAGQNSFPLHAGCPLAVPIDSMDLTKLTAL